MKGYSGTDYRATSKMLVVRARGEGKIERCLLKGTKFQSRAMSKSWRSMYRTVPAVNGTVLETQKVAGGRTYVRCSYFTLYIKDTRRFLAVMNMCMAWIVAMIARVYTFRTHPVAYVKYVQFFLCRSCLNNVV